MKVSPRVLVHWTSDPLVGPLVDALRTAGSWVRVLSKDPSQREKIAPLCHEVIQPTADELFWPYAFGGVDVLVLTCLPWHLYDSRCDAKAEVAALTDVVRRASSASVAHCLLITGLPTTNRSAFQQPIDELLDEVRNSSMNHSIVRCPALFQDLQIFIEMARRGRIYLFGQGSARINPIDASDLASHITSNLLDFSLNHQDAVVGGPEVLTWEQIARLIFDALGKAPNIRHLNETLLRILRDLSNPFFPSMADSLEFIGAVMPESLVAPPVGACHMKDWLVEAVK